jgi:NAD(P)-dependent dehydrogenase (short-subunit alcohol dehydrogenase family)
VALVTGASSGIGEHFGEVLAAAGAKVALAARRADRLAELARRIEARGGQCLPVACDVTKQESVREAIVTAEAQLGPLSVLVNNAGVVVSKPLFEHTEEDWDHVVDTNLKGAWLAAREFAHHLVELKRPGRIINISSILASRTIGRVPAYCAAKAGLTHLTHVLAMELARYGILVNALAPGYVETDFNREYFQTEAGKRLISRIPLRRLGQPPDLDGALLFLASPASAYVTGAVIAVDGGHAVAALRGGARPLSRRGERRGCG